jgi:hypothetical protein
MHRRRTRIAILCLLLAAGGVVGGVLWSSAADVQQLDRDRDAKSTTIEALLSSISAIASAQQAHTDYGQRDVSSFTRVSLLVNRITTDAAGLRAARESTVSSQRLEEFWTALSALMGAEARARERLAGGDDGGAADALLASAREHVNVLGSTLRAFRTSELESYQRARTAANLRSWIALGAAGMLWTAGLVGFALFPRRRDSELAAAAPPPEFHAPVPVTVAHTFPAIDLSEAAALSAALAQLTDQAVLPQLLARAARLLGARGVVIWMSGGSELFAVAAHGYDEALLSRIRPIVREADNITAAAWRQGELLTLPADTGGYGAIAAPLLSPAGCVGVLAAEVSDERDRDDSTRAVAMILASQLAGVLAAWPTASTADSGRGSDRQAAAS